MNSTIFGITLLAIIGFLSATNGSDNINHDSPCPYMLLKDGEYCTFDDSLKEVFELTDDQYLKVLTVISFILKYPDPLFIKSNLLNFSVPNPEKIYENTPKFKTLTKIVLAVKSQLSDNATLKKYDFASKTFNWLDVTIGDYLTSYKKLTNRSPNLMDSLDKNIKFGVTGPITTRESTEEESKKEKEMDLYLRDCGFFEDETAGQTRERVLGRLNYLLKEFVFAMAEKKKIVGEGKNVFGGKIFTFGSYRLGVHSKGADIDVLCVLPKHVTRKDFFINFFSILEKEKEIKELTKIEEAYVPLIKLNFQGIPIDLTFARLNMQIVKENVNLLNNSILKNMEEKCVLSLNGPRVTDEILNLVPNVNTFHSALRCIKYWAKRRCTYGNSYGYFAGVAFSISVARVCQMYPNVSSFVIVQKYFETYANWKWPLPVILKPIVDLSYNMKVWDPKVYPSDKYHKMPVITPAYPSICATHNITNSTQNLIQKEYQRGFEILSREGSVDSLLKDLFTLSDFFRDYKFFLQVLVLSSEEEQFGAWEGFVESKIRILATKMENIEDVMFAYPFPRPFKLEESKIPLIEPKARDVVKCTAFLVAFELTSTKINKKIYVNQPVEEFVNFINDYEKKTNCMCLEIRVLKRREVHKFLSIYYSNKTEEEK